MPCHIPTTERVRGTVAAHRPAGDRVLLDRLRRAGVRHDLEAAALFEPWETPPGAASKLV